MEVAATPNRGACSGREDDDRKGDERAADDSYQRQEESGKGQVDPKQGCLAGIESPQRFDRAKPLQLDARCVGFKCLDLARQHSVHGGAANCMMQLCATPPGYVGARQGQDRIDNQDTEEPDREECEGAKSLVGDNAIVDLQQKYRQGQGKQIDRDRRCQHIGILMQRAREFKPAPE